MSGLGYVHVIWLRRAKTCCSCGGVVCDEHTFLILISFVDSRNWSFLATFLFPANDVRFAYSQPEGSVLKSCQISEQVRGHHNMRQSKSTCEEEGRAKKENGPA